MFINPKVAIDEGWVTGITNEKQIQPNAIDFTLDTVYSINVSNTFIISEEYRQMRGGSAIPPVSLPSGPTRFFWDFQPNSIYDCLSSMHVTVPEGVAALLVARSTFVRNGLFIASGLYDSGFKGHVGFVLHNRGGTARVFTGTRVGQVVFVQADTAHMYAGGYSHDAGTVAPHQV